MKILLTGACGFVGSVLARALVERVAGLMLVGVDNLSRKGSETNVEPLRALGVDVRVGDISDPGVVSALPAVDYVIDCAANPSVLAGLDDAAGGSRALIEQNLYSTVNLLEFCRRHGAGFLLLSTSRVYAIPAMRAIPLETRGDRFAPAMGAAGEGWSERGLAETFSTVPPVSLYGSSKLCSELLALEYGEAFGFPVWINRCGVLAGAGQFGRAEQGIFSFWLHAWRSGRPLRYTGFGGTGHQVRDCLHPRDLADVILRQIHAGSTTAPRICHFAGGIEQTMSLRELSAWCAARFPGRELPAADPSERAFDVPWVVLDSAQAGAAWGWRPETGLDVILEEIATHAEANPRWLDLVA